MSDKAYYMELNSEGLELLGDIFKDGKVPIVPDKDIDNDMDDFASIYGSPRLIDLAFCSEIQKDRLIAIQAAKTGEILSVVAKRVEIAGTLPIRSKLLQAERGDF